jgi:hypothetical protein
MRHPIARKCLARAKDPDFEARCEAGVGPGETARCYCRLVDVTGCYSLVCQGGRISPTGPRTFPCSASARR